MSNFDSYLLELIHMIAEQFLSKDKFEKTLEHFKQEISTLRTGRANSQILDNVRVSAYGAMMTINEVASVTAPDPQLVIVKPWDKSLMAEIEKGIQSAQLNLNPVVDGDIIRIVVPPLTLERRQQLIKILYQKAEEAKVMIRNIRAEMRREIEKQEGSSGVSEDDIKATEADLDALAKEYVEEIDEQLSHKEKELSSI